MKTRFCEKLLFVLILTFFLPVMVFQGFNACSMPADTTGVDSSEQAAGIYRNVDIKIIYSWNPEEPDVFQNVSCQLIKKENVVIEVKIMRSDATDRISIKPEYMQFEVRDHQTKKIIAKSP